MWSKRTTEAATLIGMRAVGLLSEHDGGHAYDATARHLIARACALAVDEVIGTTEPDARALRDLEMAHADGFTDLDTWRAWWRKRG